MVTYVFRKWDLRIIELLGLLDRDSNVQISSTYTILDFFSKKKYVFNSIFKKPAYFGLCFKLKHWHDEGSITNFIWNFFFALKNLKDVAMPSSLSPSTLPDESFNLDKILNDEIREDEDLVLIYPKRIPKS